MNNDNDNENSSGAVNQAGRMAKKGAQKAYQSGKQGVRTSARIIAFLIRYWWLGLGVLAVLAAIFGMMFMVAIFGGNDEESNPCATGTGDGPTDSKVDTKSAPNPLLAKRINETYRAARKLAPQRGVLPSVVLADEFENPNNAKFNYWGLGYNDSTSKYNQGFRSVEDGVEHFLNTVVTLTRGRVITDNPQDGMRALAEADGQHIPPPVYHTQPAYHNGPDGSPGYWYQLSPQYDIYKLGRFDKNIDYNHNAVKSNLNNIKYSSDNGSNSDCNDDNSQSDSNSIYNYAARFQQQVPYSAGVHERLEFGNDLPNPNSSDHADCSSFVWSVLKATGYKVDSNQWDTVQMESSPNLKHINADEARQGDILNIPYGDDAHTMILASDKWYGAGNSKTRVIDEGGMLGKAYVNQNTYKYAMGGTPQPTFLRPIKNNQ